MLISSVAPHTAQHTHHVALKAGRLVGWLVELVQDGFYFVLCTSRYLYRGSKEGDQGGERRKANGVQCKMPGNDAARQ